MKKIYFVISGFIILIASLSFKSDHSFRTESSGVMFAFITYNDYGNNLYIDNFTIGERKDYDISIDAIENISPDTSYINTLLQSDTIEPVVELVNIGRNTFADSFYVYMSIQPSGYFDSAMVERNFAGGSAIKITFPPAVFSLGVLNTFKIYSAVELDTNRSNDTLVQSSVFFAGTTRNVLFEEFTSMQSISAALNNPGVTLFTAAYPDSACIIKYHIDSPLGIDSLYLQDSAYLNIRKNYYNPLSIPMLYVDGNIKAGFPYTDTSNLGNPFRTRLADATPVSMNASEERFGADSVRMTVNFDIVSPVQNGNYKLRVFAVEKQVTYSAPPGSNGENIFYDVLRKDITGTDGISISTAQGNQTFQFAFLREPGWVDSMLYTVAFIQNDRTKEVFNCAKGRSIILPRIYSPVNYSAQNSIVNYAVDSTDVFYAQLFEGSFPPPGWRILNDDADITFGVSNAANGPSYGGLYSMFMNFYNYNSRGNRDTLYTKNYAGVKSIDTLRFDYAYARYDSFHSDSLIILASTDGGQTFPHVIFTKGGDSLATTIQTTSNFVPQPNNWRTFIFPLTTVIQDQLSTGTVADHYELYQNYPNPFNPATTIKFTLQNNSDITLTVYDITGREIRKLANGFFTAGSHQIVFNSEGLSSGVYFYKLSIRGEGNLSLTKKMVVVK